MNSEIYIFDRKIKQLQRDRSVKKTENNFILNHAKDMLCEHLEGITREFPIALDLAARTGLLSNSIQNKFGIQKIIATDLSQKLIEKNSNKLKLVADEEIIPFAKGSFDIILSLLNLHWVNDLPGCLIQLQKSLKKDGLFIASIFGGETLKELRQSLIKTEEELFSGSSPRISPFADIRDAAGLLQRAGFAMPVADAEKITVMYKNLNHLFEDLRGMAETNAVIKRNKKYVGKNFFKLLEKNYFKDFSIDEEIPVTFEIITISGSKN